MPVTPIKSFDEFRKIISNEERTAIIDFWATWCGPCRAISPIFEQLSEINPDLDFYSVDVDAQEAITEEVGIRAMPTFMCFRDGDKIGDLTGASPVALKELVVKYGGKAE
ncbi:thioredoxin family protein [Rhodotorula paludigena]|uniref:thioredoxin family protein n=1 Tax=Rhodotorula paludigena TaxID=86838 RepID=UPI00316C8204